MSRNDLKSEATQLRIKEAMDLCNWVRFKPDPKIHAHYIAYCSHPIRTLCGKECPIDTFPSRDKNRRAIICHL